MALPFRFSLAGCLAASLFVAAALGVFAWVFLVASKNPADSGESGILLLPFAMPWVALLPSPWLGPGAGAGCIALNALIVYCLVGGLRPARGPR